MFLRYTSFNTKFSFNTKVSFRFSRNALARVVISKRATVIPRLMCGSGGFASDTRPSAFRGCTPVSRAGMRRLVAIASLPSFSSLGCAFTQFHARLSVGARDGYRYTRGALPARARGTRLPFVRFVLPAPGYYHFVNICFFGCSRLTLILF